MWGCAGVQISDVQIMSRKIVIKQSILFLLFCNIILIDEKATLDYSMLTLRC